MVCGKGVALTSAGGVLAASVGDCGAKAESLYGCDCGEIPEASGSDCVNLEAMHFQQRLQLDRPRLRLCLVLFCL